VDEFSRFARMPAPVLKNISLSQIIQEAAAVYQDMAEIELKISKSLPSVKVDPEQIKRVFINIIDNALSAGRARKVEISAEFEESRSEIIVYLRDNGRGIRGGDINRIFEPYYSRKKGGTGLGLAIVKSILEAHDAVISVDHNQPSGLVFKIKFKC